jgi:hypothetical protein
MGRYGENDLRLFCGDVKYYTQSVNALVELFCARTVKYVSSYNVLHMLTGNYGYKHGRFGLIIVTYELF